MAFDTRFLRPSHHPGPSGSPPARPGSAAAPTELQRGRIERHLGALSSPASNARAGGHRRRFLPGTGVAAISRHPSRSRPRSSGPCPAALSAALRLQQNHQRPGGFWPFPLPHCTPRQLAEHKHPFSPLPLCPADTGPQKKAPGSLCIRTLLQFLFKVLRNASAQIKVQTRPYASDNGMGFI